MTKNIALCGVGKEIRSKLEQYGAYNILQFLDEPEWRGDVKLAYFMRNGLHVELAIVGYSGADGLVACDYLRMQNSKLPILWLCNRQEFQPEAKRLGVNFYVTGPPGKKFLTARLLSASPSTGSKSAACRSG